MSAFVVDPYHMAYLHSYADRQHVWPEDEREGAITAMWNQCVRSVAYRYPDCTEDDLPGTIGRTRTLPENARWPIVEDDFNPRRVLAAIGCLEYQSCETRDYEQTDAYAYTMTLARRALAELRIDAGDNERTEILRREHMDHDAWEINAPAASVPA